MLWATYYFAFQIYCDFSGYTDIAIGCARLFDLHMTRNFAYPYFAESIIDFWHRWHISLSTWFREYLYIPLGGNRRGPTRTLFNIFAVFVVSGLWHGANWTFVIWGLLHGVFYCVQWLAAGRTTTVASAERPGFRLRRLVNMLVTFHLVLAAWVFFRADDVTDAVTVLQKIFTAPLTTFVQPQRQAVIWIVVLLLVEWRQRHRQHGLDIAESPRAVRWAAYYATAAAILLFAQLDYVPFIYFQF